MHKGNNGLSLPVVLSKKQGKFAVMRIALAFLYAEQRNS